MNRCHENASGGWQRVLRLGMILSWLALSTGAAAQSYWTTHTRGKLWETLWNFGYIGHPGAWDYEEKTGIGFYPGFSGFSWPNDEQDANGWITDANFHNFRTGPWILVKGADALVPPDLHPEPKDFLLYHSSMATGDAGVLESNPYFVKTNNFVGTAEYDPLLPEEINENWFPTATGITVRQRSMAWSFPGYQDFIIFDFTFKNTGDMALPSVNRVEHYEQDLNEVWIVLHSGIQVSTKGTLNFHENRDKFEDSAAPAGGFGGWHQYEKFGGYTDYYAVENDGADGKGLLFYSRDYNGGREPHPNDIYRKRENWQEELTVAGYDLPELQDPACFGFVFLYRTPPNGSTADPFDADPNYFSIYNDEGDNFKHKTLDMNESFGLDLLKLPQLYQFITTSRLPANNGDMYCWYTASFGPYSLAVGDSVRLVFAEVAGELDLHDIVSGDPEHHYPDSSIAAIRRHAEAVRQAVKWGFGVDHAGMNLVADVPDSPPSPNCLAVNVSAGSDSAIIAVRWDRLAEETVFTDGSGTVFFDGAADLSGYRIFRGRDKRGIWDLVADITKSEADSLWCEDLGMYEYKDMDLEFGFEFYYYVQAYWSDPPAWTSANGTVVERLGELVSADNNRTRLIGARPGPEDLARGWDVFVAPNPYVEGDPARSFGEPTPQKIEFRNLPERATIKIYTLSGDLIKTIGHGPDEYGNMFGSISWDQRTESGLLVAPGLYIYVVRSNTEGYVGSKMTGKLMIIR